MGVEDLERSRLDWESNFRPDILVPARHEPADPKPKNSDFPERKGRIRLGAAALVAGEAGKLGQL